MRYNKSVYSIYILYCYFSIALAADDELHNTKHKVLIEPEVEESTHYMKLNKDGVKVYIFKHKNSAFATFRATTQVNASLESLLAVILDIKSGTRWIDACEESFLIKKLSFNEQYHYQTFYIPFPFKNRDFILHSTLVHDPVTQAITITMSSAPDYCRDKQSKQCTKTNTSELVRVNKSIGTFKLQANEQGTAITWIQHTNPAGHLPAWLVNQLIKDTAYKSFKNLAEIVKEQQYKDARLTYDENGIAIAVEIKKQAETRDETYSIAEEAEFYQTL